MRKKTFYKFSKIIFIAILLLTWLWPPALKEAQALDVANGDGLIVYPISANTTPQWRTYTNSTNAFGAQTATVAGATGLNFITRTSPTKQEAIAGYTNSGGTLQVMCYDGTSWTNEWSVAVGGTGTTRRFDIAYETNSGDVIVLYSGNVGTTNELRYRTKLGSTGCGSANWSAETNLDPVRTSGTVLWVKMAWDKRAAQNLIAAIWADSNSDLSAMIWSGTAWGNEPSAVTEASLEVVAAAQDVDDFDVEYESISGDVMVVWANSAGANGTNGVRYRTCTGGTSTCTWNAVTTPPTWTDDATNLDLCSDPNSDGMIFVSIGNAGSDLQYGVWSGSAWTNTANGDTASATPLAGTKLVACGYLISGATTRGVITYNDSAATNIGWRTVSGTTWTSQTDFTPTPAFGNPQKWYDIQTDPINKDRLMFTLSDLNLDLFAKRLTMDATPTFTWTNADGGAALQASLSQATAGPFSFAYWRNIPAPTFNQSAYRLFNNLDSTDVGTALAAQDTAATLGSTGALFRLRMLLHIGANQLAASGQTFKLQFAQQSGTCDTGFVGETYADVTAATVIAYKDNATPADGATMTANANDPTHEADPIEQTYEELNNFTNSVAAIPSGQDGKWDFALFDNGATASTAYCLRAVKSDGTLLDTYTVIPQITTAAAASLTFVVTTDNFPTITPGSPVFATSTLSVDTNNSTGWNVTVSRDDTDTTLDLDTDAAVNITDQTAWVPGAATTTAGNAVRISSFINSGDVLAMRVMTASGTPSFISTTWWGTTDAYIDSATTLWAGFNSAAQKIGDSSVSSGGSAKLNTVLYYLDVPSTQQTGAYSGGITYTATMNP